MEQKKPLTRRRLARKRDKRERLTLNGNAEEPAPGGLSDIPRLLQQYPIFQVVFDSITDLISIQDKDFKIVAVNQAYADAFEMKPEEIIGRRCYEIVHRTSHPIVDCPHMQTLKTKKAVTGEQYDPCSGTYLQVTASPVFDLSGEIAGTVHLMKNVTAQKETQEALRKSNERYRNLVESTSDFIWETNREGVCNYASPKIYDILGYEAEEMIGKTPFDLMPPEEAERVFPIFQECVSHQSPINSLEYVVYHKDGHPVILETSGVPLFDVDGTLKGYRGIDRDITRRKEMEEELRKSEERLRQYFDLGLVGMAVESPSGAWVMVNDRLCEIYGYSREELMRLHWKDLTHPDDLDKDLVQLEQMLEGKINSYSLEKRYIRKNGEIMHALVSAGCARDRSGDVSSIFALVVDITDRKNMEESLEKAKDELELKVKQRTGELAEAKEQLEVYTREIIRAQERERKRVAAELHDDTAQNLALIILEIDKIINSLEKLPEDTLGRLKLLRYDVDRTQKEVRRFSHELRPGMLDHLGLEAALEGLAKDINDKGDIKVDLETRGKERRLPDEVELSLFRIAQEALNNSLKHSQAVRASISLRFYPRRVTLRISDNGKGFDVRRDSRNAVKRRRLGLIGMRERAELIGGRLKIRSVAGKGASVSIEVMQ